MADSESASPPLELRLFGAFEARVNGAPLPRLRSRKGQWLLGLLALRAGQEVERGWLAGLLWPDSGEAAAMANLRCSLKDLRRALGPAAGCLHSPTTRTLSFIPSQATLDLIAFDAAIARGMRDLPRESGALVQAVALYRGPLLEGCGEEWVFSERRAREEAYLNALEALAAHSLAKHGAAAAQNYLRRAAAVDPLRESVQRRLMEALAAEGSYAAALAVYRELRLRLHRELNTAPDPMTQALFETLRAHARGQARPRQAVIGTPPSGGRKTTPVESAGTEERPAGDGQLPLPLTRFIGREREAAQVERLLAAARLLTLTGAGGCGKTRLALCVACSVRKEYADGVWLVELAALADPALVPQTVALSLGLRERPDRSLVEALVDHLRPRSLLLVLDNCEHLLSACTCLAEHLLRTCPDIRILAASRERLRIEGEQTYRVPSLSLPGEGVPLPEAEAVQLFVDRASLAQPDFAPTPFSGAAVAEICRRLDGIPLALELAAARLRIMPIEKLAARLEDRFRILTGGSRTALPRHQTLRALIDWSYDLLSEPERWLFQWLSIFAGGWTLEAAEAVCGVDVFDGLAALVDKSLVQHEAADGEGRYRMLETLRHYAGEQLCDAGDIGAARDRHRQWCLGLLIPVQGAEPPNQPEWMDRLEREIDNVRAALQGCREDPAGVEAGLEMAGALTRFWAQRGSLREGSQWLAAVLAREGTADFPAARAKALWGAAGLLHFRGDCAAAQRLAEESVALCRKWGDKAHLALALGMGGEIANSMREHERARSLLEESLLLFRELGSRPAPGLFNLAQAAHGMGDLALARSYCEECISLCRESGSLYIAWPLLRLGRVALAEGKPEEARPLVRESLSVFHRSGNKLGLVHSLGVRIELLLVDGHAAPAARLLGAIAALREAMGAPPRDGEMMERTRERLGAEAFAVAWAEGQAMPLDQAISEAVSG